MSIDIRDPDCVAAWPECEPGLYDPRCCRFPKSCSCDTIVQGETTICSNMHCYNRAPVSKDPAKPPFCDQHRK